MNVAGMLVAVAGIVVQIATGVDYPTIPPGPIILLVAAGIVRDRSLAMVADRRGHRPGVPAGRGHHR